MGDVAEVGRDLAFPVEVGDVDPEGGDEVVDRVGELELRIERPGLGAVEQDSADDLVQKLIGGIRL